MKCDRTLELLSEYIDGELSPAGALGVQSHLRRCEACEAEYQALHRTVQMVALYGRQQIPIDCRQAVMARLQPRSAPSLWAPWLSLERIWPVGGSMMTPWARATAVAGLAAISIGAGMHLFNANRTPADIAGPTQRLVRDDHARMRESYQLLQALGRDDGYILAADVVDENR
jgi:anti-sigma factor RsiW